MPSHYNNGKNGKKKMSVPSPGKLVKNPPRKSKKGSASMKAKMAKLRAMKKK